MFMYVKRQLFKYIRCFKLNIRIDLFIRIVCVCFNIIIPFFDK